MAGALDEERSRVRLRPACPIGTPERSQWPTGWPQVRAWPLRDHRLDSLGAPPAVAGGEVDGLLGDGLFRFSGGPSQVLDDLPVAIARLEVHPGVDLRRVLAQDVLDMADILEDILPIFDIDGPQV